MFSQINRRSYENPKVHLTFNDARNYMNTTRKQYDIIISEPSNPWIAGVASLFTAEFYDRAAQVLKPDGVFAQWIQLYELDPEDLRMVLYEVQRKFPEVSVWVTDSDLIIIATRQPQKLNMTRVANIVRSDPSMVRDFRDFLHSEQPEGLLSYYVMSTDAVKQALPLKRGAIRTIIRCWSSMHRGSCSRIRAISTSICCTKPRTACCPMALKSRI